jgi:hypothetical protein
MNMEEQTLQGASKEELIELILKERRHLLIYTLIIALVSFTIGVVV